MGFVRAALVIPLQRLCLATRYSCRGFGAAWRTQAALRYELYVFVIVIPAAWWIGDTSVERTLLIGSWILVVIVEVINSAIEAIVDRIGSELHELSGRAKDLGSAAVFCSIVLAAMIWLTLWLD
ncbi:MAG TPA: diacylglycerol kinase [Candidatus Binatia bacterium]|jgi:diacylglycerol kinase (ATP)